MSRQEYWVIVIGLLALASCLLLQEIGLVTARQQIDNLRNDISVLQQRAR